MHRAINLCRGTLADISQDSATETQQASHPWFHHWLKSGATYQQQLPAFAAARENLEAQWKKTQRTTAVNEAADPERFDAINAVYTAASEGLKKLKTSAATESEHVVAHLDGLPEGLEGPTDDEKKATEIFNILSKFYWDMDRTEPSVEQTQKADAARTTFKERPPQIKGVRVESLASLLEILFPEDEEFETSPSQISSSPSEIEAYRLDQVSKQILQMFASLGPGE